MEFANLERLVERGNANIDAIGEAVNDVGRQE